MIGLIRRAGLEDRDEVMDVYVHLCDQLTAREFAKLKSQDASRGSIGGWLAVVARHAVVDWIRSRKGRRRLFAAVKELSSFDQRVFEMYYWDNYTPGEIVELLRQGRAGLTAVFDALERIHNTLSGRHRAELLALAARSRTPVAIHDSPEAERIPDSRGDPEAALRIQQTEEILESALGRLAPIDAAIIRLKYLEGLTPSDIQHALGLTGLSSRRMDDILARLRAALSDLASGQLSFDRSVS